MSNLASLITSETKTVDVAALGQKISAPTRDDSHVVKTELIYLGKCEFKKLFFSKDGENFDLNRQICDQGTSINNASYYNAMAFDSRFKAVDDNCKTGARLILQEHLMSCYESDTGMERDCWDICSRMEIQKAVSCVKALCDVGLGCDILCSLKWSEVEHILNVADINVCNGTVNETTAITQNTSPVRQILQISAIFKSSSPDIRDCVITFRYAVDMRDPCAHPESYFKFGNPEYLLGNFSLSFNGGANLLEGKFQPDKFHYFLDVDASNEYDVRVKPEILADSFFASHEYDDFRRQDLLVKVMWFNDADNITGSGDCLNSELHHASVAFDECTARAEGTARNLIATSLLELPTYANDANSPLLKVTIQNKHDLTGETRVTYHFQICPRFLLTQ